MRSESPARHGQLRASALIILEVIGFCVLAVFSKSLLDPVTERFSGPITLLTTLMILAAYRHWRGQSWRDAGLVSLPGIKAKLMVLPKALLAFVAIIGTGVLLSVMGEALDIGFMQENTDAMTNRLGDIKGNLPLYLLWLGVAWVSAGFAEELFFRGFVISRLIDAFGDSRWMRVLAVVVAALFFGACHMYYQGLRGLVVTGMIGLVLGFMFLFYKRSLWPLMIAHALVDTLGVTAHFLDLDI